MISVMGRAKAVLPFALGGAFALGALAVVFRHPIEHWLLLAGSGALAWRLLLAHAGIRPRRRRRRSLVESVRVWFETFAIGWIAANTSRSRRGRIDPEQAVPIATLQPVYRGRFADEPASRYRGGGVLDDDEPLPF